MIKVFTFLFLLLDMTLMGGIIVHIIGCVGHTMKGGYKYDFTKLATVSAKVIFASLILLGVHNVIVFPFLCR